MKSFKEDFYLRLKAGFTPENEDQFLELWKDIEEQIDNMEFSGMSNEEIIKDLGSPEEIYREYYLDMNIQTALSTKEQMIPAGEIDQVIKIKKKLKILSKIDKIGHTLFWIIRIIILLVCIFMAVYFAYELIAEKHISIASGILFLSTALMVSGMFRITKKGTGRKQAMYISAGFLISVAVILLTQNKSWLQYQGVFFSENWSIDPQEIDTINFKANIPVILVIKDSPDDMLRFQVDGDASRRIIDEITAQNTNVIKQNYRLELKDNALFKMFTHIPELHISLWLPESISLSELVIDLQSGEIVVDQQNNISNIAVTLEKGQVICSQITDTNLTIQTKRADILVQEQRKGSLSVTTDQGKTIVQRSSDVNMNLESVQGFIRLQDLSSHQIFLRNLDGRTVINNSDIESLSAESTSGAIIVSKQNGQTEIQTLTGDIIMTDLTGNIKLDNREGVIIATQNYPLDGTIYAGSGLVRWQQKDDPIMNFTVETTSQDTINEFQNSESIPESKHIEIKSDSGPIKIFRAR